MGLVIRAAIFLWCGLMSLDGFSGDKIVQNVLNDVTSETLSERHIALTKKDILSILEGEPSDQDRRNFWGQAKEISILALAASTMGSLMGDVSNKGRLALLSLGGLTSATACGIAALCSSSRVNLFYGQVQMIDLRANDICIRRGMRGVATWLKTSYLVSSKIIYDSYLSEEVFETTSPKILKFYNRGVLVGDYPFEDFDPDFSRYSDVIQDKMRSVAKNYLFNSNAFECYGDSEERNDYLQILNEGIAMRPSR